MPYKLGYKLVRAVDNELLSSHSPRSRDYSKVWWTRPSAQCGDLCVFDNYRDARNFSSLCWNIEIEELRLYLCLYETSKARKVYTFDRGDGFLNLERMPHGKALAKKVMLLVRLPIIGVFNV
jgi:hypothetical protein